MVATRNLRRIRARAVNGEATPKLARSPWGCGHGTILYATASTVGAFRMRCHSWACAYCAPRLAAKWTRTLQEAAFAPRTFATLTIDPSHLEAACGCNGCKGDVANRPASCLLLDHARQHQIFMGRWRQLLQALRREAKRQGKPLSYFRATEHHAGAMDRVRRIRNYREHWHMLLTLDLGGGFKPGAHLTPDQPVYSEAADRFAALAQRHGFGICRAYTIDPAQTGVRHYVAKYASKADKGGNAIRCRLIAVSKDIRHPVADKLDVIDHHLLTAKSDPSIDQLAASLPRVAAAVRSRDNLSARLLDSAGPWSLGSDRDCLLRWTRYAAREYRPQTGSTVPRRSPTASRLSGTTSRNPLADRSTIEHARLDLQTYETRTITT